MILMSGARCASIMWEIDGDEFCVAVLDDDPQHLWKNASSLPDVKSEGRWDRNGVHNHLWIHASILTPANGTKSGDGAPRIARGLWRCAPQNAEGPGSAAPPTKRS